MDLCHTVLLSNQVSVMSRRNRGPGRLKLVLIGNQHVGKTSLLNRYLKDMFNPAYTHTRGGDVFEKEVVMDGSKINLKLLDTAGQSDVRTLIQSIYRDANGIMIVFDVTNEESFEMVKEWIDRIEQTTPIAPQLVLVGNKHDLQIHRKIETERATQRAVDFSAPFYDVSAKTGYNVREAFEALIKETWRNLQPVNHEIDQPIRLEECRAQESRPCCKS